MTNMAAVDRNDGDEASDVADLSCDDGTPTGLGRSRENQKAGRLVPTNTPPLLWDFGIIA